MSKYLDKHFLEEDIQMLTRALKDAKHYSSLGDANQKHRLFPLIRMAIIKKKRTIKRVSEDVEKWNPKILLVGILNVVISLENSLAFLKKPTVSMLTFYSGSNVGQAQVVFSFHMHQELGERV